MAEFTVYFNTGASSLATVEVDLDDLDLTNDDDRETARERIEMAAWNKLDTALCHHCAGKVDLGDWETDEKITGFDADDED